MNQGRIILSIILFVLPFFFINIASANATAPVSGFVHQFAIDKPIPNAIITILETKQKIVTRDDGTFGPIDWPVGSPITLLFEKPGFRTIQSATLIVPPEGLTDPFHNISFQVFDVFTFYLMAGAVGKLIDENKCHLVATITDYHKTMADLPQGIAGATAILTPATTEKPFYLDIFKDGPLKNYTNPFTRGLTSTSEDGGVLFANLEPSDEPYTLTATKSGKVFNSVQFYCRKGVFVNISPPIGPSVQQ